MILGIRKFFPAIEIKIDILYNILRQCSIKPLFRCGADKYYFLIRENDNQVASRNADRCPSVNICGFCRGLSVSDQVSI